MLLLRVHAGGGLVEQQQLRLRSPARGRSRAGAGCRTAGSWRARPARSAELEDLEQRRARSRSIRASSLAMAPACAGPPSSASSRAGRCERDLTLSSTVSSAKRRMFWNVRAMPRRGDLVAASRPSIALPSNTDRAGGRRVDAGDQIEDGRLAGAVGADQAVELRPARSRASSVVDGRQAAEPHRDLATAARMGTPAPSRSSRSRRAPRRSAAPLGRHVTNSRVAQQPLRPDDHQQDQQQRVEHHRSRYCVERRAAPRAGR